MSKFETRGECREKGGKLMSGGRTLDERSSYTFGERWYACHLKLRPAPLQLEPLSSSRLRLVRVVSALSRDINHILKLPAWQTERSEVSASCVVAYGKTLMVPGRTVISLHSQSV